MTTPEPPADLQRSGRKLWRSVLKGFDLDEHELTLLREACRTADLIDQLQGQLTADGIMSTSSQGVRVHPAAVELRQQRIAFARLLSALRVPSGEEGDGRLPVRPMRGVYRFQGGGE